MFADPFFLGMLRSAQVAIAAAGLQLVFTVTSGPDDTDASSSTPPAATSTACC